MSIVKKIVGAGIALAVTFGQAGFTADASDEIAHDPSRDVQTEGVGNPFNYGERNTPADASTAEIRKINHDMSVQEVKYALYKEIDEHWDLISVRLGQPDREKVYALFLGIGSRESTLGGNGDGADIETAQSEGFGVSSAHAYGTLQTAVTAFADCDPSFMKEDNVPEMYQYSLSESTFYDAIISNHMGIRKILHFVEIGINQEGLEGYQVVRGALKGFNTGWCDYTGDNEGYYKNYPDEITAMAHWYYAEGHLYDNVFTWTTDKRADPYRTGANDWWEWWGDGQPSMAEITEKPQPQETTATSTAETTTTTTTTTETATTSVETSTTESTSTSTTTSTMTTSTTTSATTTTSTLTTSTSETTTTTTSVTQDRLYGDANLDGKVSVADAVAILQHIGCRDKYELKPEGLVNADVDGSAGLTATDALVIQKVDAGIYKQSELPLAKA